MSGRESLHEPISLDYQHENGPESLQESLRLMAHQLWVDAAVEWAQPNAANEPVMVHVDNTDGSDDGPYAFAKVGSIGVFINTTTGEAVYAYGVIKGDCDTEALGRALNVLPKPNVEEDPIYQLQMASQKALSEMGIAAHPEVPPAVITTLEQLSRYALLNKTGLLYSERLTVKPRITILLNPAEALTLLTSEELSTFLGPRHNAAIEIDYLKLSENVQSTELLSDLVSSTDVEGDDLTNPDFHMLRRNLEAMFDRRGQEQIVDALLFAMGDDLAAGYDERNFYSYNESVTTLAALRPLNGQPYLTRFAPIALKATGVTQQKYIEQLLKSVATTNLVAVEGGVLPGHQNQALSAVDSEKLALLEAYFGIYEMSDEHRYTFHDLAAASGRITVAHNVVAHGVSQDPVTVTAHHNPEPGELDELVATGVVGVKDGLHVVTGIKAAVRYARVSYIQDGDPSGYLPMADLPTLRLTPADLLSLLSMEPEVMRKLFSYQLTSTNIETIVEPTDVIDKSDSELTGFIDFSHVGSNLETYFTRRQQQDLLQHIAQYKDDNGRGLAHIATKLPSCLTGLVRLSALRSIDDAVDRDSYQATGFHPIADKAAELLASVQQQSGLEGKHVLAKNRAEIVLEAIASVVIRVLCDSNELYFPYSKLHPVELVVDMHEVMLFADLFADSLQPLGDFQNTGGSHRQEQEAVMLRLLAPHISTVADHLNRDVTTHYTNVGRYASLQLDDDV